MALPTPTLPGSTSDIQIVDSGSNTWDFPRGANFGEFSTDFDLRTTAVRGFDGSIPLGEQFASARTFTVSGITEDRSAINDILFASRNAWPVRLQTGSGDRFVEVQLKGYTEDPRRGYDFDYSLTFETIGIPFWQAKTPQSIDLAYTGPGTENILVTPDSEVKVYPRIRMFNASGSVTDVSIENTTFASDLGTLATLSGVSNTNLWWQPWNFFPYNPIGKVTDGSGGIIAGNSNDEFLIHGFWLYPRTEQTIAVDFGAFNADVNIYWRDLYL